jgi:aerobic carbon-monoxide dehydrogenase medium subunit
MAWFTPDTVHDALRLKAERPDAVVVAGGTFVGILCRQGLLAADDWISLHGVDGLTAVTTGGDLSLGAMVRHRHVELDPVIGRFWPGVARVFAAVASPRVRNVATVGGMLADADYASDPPSMLVALDAWVEVASLRGTRRVAVADLITGYYETALADDELITRLVVPRRDARVAYRKLRTRSAEDRPCVSVSAVRTGDRLRVVVGAVCERPQYFPDVCAAFVPDRPGTAADIGRGYAERIDPIADARGSAGYRRNAIAVEVRRAVEEVTRT